MCDAAACDQAAAAASATPAGIGNGMPASIFVADDADVHDVPMAVIRRPLIPSLDEAKVLDFMEKLKAGVQLTPIEVAWVQVPEGTDAEGGGGGSGYGVPPGSYYYAFGGCHRWEAHRRLATPTIRAKLVRVSPHTISTYLGASSPFRRQDKAPAAAPS